MGGRLFVKIPRGRRDATDRLVRSTARDAGARVTKIETRLAMWPVPPARPTLRVYHVAGPGFIRLANFLARRLDVIDLERGGDT